MEVPKYKVLRGLRPRKSTLSCKSIYNPKDQSTKETKDVIDCTIYLANNEHENWNKIQKQLKSADSTIVKKFQIQVETNIPNTEYQIQVSDLCTGKNVKCDNVMPMQYMEEFLKLIPKNPIIVTSPTMNPPNISALPLNSPPRSPLPPPPSLSSPPSNLPPSSLNSPPSIIPSTINKPPKPKVDSNMASVVKSLDTLNKYKNINTSEACKKMKSDIDIDPIWVEYTISDNENELKTKCMPLTDDGFYDAIVEKELCLKLKNSTNIYPKLNEFNISWDVIEKPKDFIIQPTSRYDPSTQHKFDMEYEELMNTKATKQLSREEFQKQLSALETKYKPLRLQPITKKMMEKKEFCSISRKFPKIIKEAQLETFG